MRVSNRQCVRRISLRSLKAAKARNIVAVLAIGLTALLFTSLFTIVASINYSFQQENFRQAGGDFHGSIKDVSLEQAQQLRQDPLIRESFLRLFIGMPEDPPFHKSHVEVSYMEPAAAPHYFCAPTQGALPQEGTDQAATDTRVLSLLGVEPKVGARFTLSFYLDNNTSGKQLVTRTFTLSGWWDYDSAVTASHVLLPRSAAEQLALLSNGEPGSLTGQWTLDVNFANSSHIQQDLDQVLERGGYQSEDYSQPNYLNTGVNWGYSGAQLSQSLDPSTLLAVSAMLLLILFTGYLIIYNVFQISVANDIRFYGLLKTIGTTGRQLKTLVRWQALVLSLAGIPLGLLLGFLVGNQLTPVVMAQLSYPHAFVTFNPWIFIGAALFSLLTVFISCAKPGRMAARVSPIEASRYAEGAGRKQSVKKGGQSGAGAKLPAMARANLGRNRSKTVITTLSLSLAVVLMNLTYSFAIGFDMDKYLQSRANVDFILADANYFQSKFHSQNQAVPEQIIQQVQQQGAVTQQGRIYGQTFSALEFVTEDWFRASWGKWNDEQTLQWMIDDARQNTENAPEGLLMDRVSLYGMEQFPLSKLEVLEGELDPLSDPGQNAIAAVVLTDDYDQPQWGSHWAKLGDKITIRYVEQWESYYTDTGEIIPELNDQITEGSRPYSTRPKQYRDVEYTVCALVQVPNNLSYRYWGADQFILGADRFLQDSSASDVMSYVFDVEDSQVDSMEQFLAEYTDTVQPLYDYESRASYAAEFEGFQNMFLILGGTLSLIIALVGVLNFINATLTGILARRREFAVLQAVGMTGKQLKTMLAWEGVYYTLFSICFSLALYLAFGPALGTTCSSVFWFFSYRFTVTPILAAAPFFLLLGLMVPLLAYRSAVRLTLVERLRQSE